MRNIPAFIILIFMCNLSFAQYSGKIIKVYDGETIWVKLENGDIDSVKLWGIDAPELDQKYGIASKEHLIKQIHREVKLEYKSRDRQKYMQAIVNYTLKSGEEVNLNNSLVEHGYAWKNKYSNDKHLEKLQKKAEKNNAGLWKESTPTPPWARRPCS